MFFKPMLAKDADPAKLTFPLFGQPKLDGIRASIVDGKLLSRTLKPIPNAEIRQALERPAFEGLDGELIVGEPTAADCYRRTSSFVMAPDKTDEPWAFFAFDKWDDVGPFNMRYNEVSTIAAAHNWTDIPIFALGPVQLDNLAELENYEAEQLELGMEGIIVRDPVAPYKFGRSGKAGPLLKIKRFIDFEAEVIGVYEENHNANVATTNELGRTARSSAKAGKIGKGTLGGLILRALNGAAEGVEFRCGTGFDAAMRADLWIEWHKQPFTGRIVKVKSFPIGVKDKPRHPVYVGMRSSIDM